MFDPEDVELALLALEEGDGEEVGLGSASPPPLRALPR